MVKNSFLLIAILSLIYGVIFFITPHWFVDFSAAKSVNVAWLRSIGASIIGLLFFGCFLIYLNPIGKLQLLRVITMTSLLQTLGLIYSRYLNEFSAKNILIIDMTLAIAIIVTIYFIALVFTRKKYFN